MEKKYLGHFSKILQLRHSIAYIEWSLKYSRALRKFRDLHHGEDCFILGNGPSLNKVDLDQLADYYTFGLNKIFLLFDKVNYRPTYHVAVNRLVIEQSVREFESLSCPSFLSFVPSRNKIRYLKHINFILTGGPRTFSGNLVGMVNEGWTVTYVAMQIAYYMGFKNVFLVGVDHNFVVRGVPNETQLFKGVDINHFDSKYFSNMEWQPPDLDGSESSYRLAKFFYERNGRNIFDATVDGKLQIFPKLSFEKALELCKKRKADVVL